MEFNELKMILDSHSQKPLYAMKEAAWHTVALRRSQKRNRRSSRCFAGEITVGVVCGGLILVSTGMLSFGDLAWAWLGTLSWVEIAALTVAAIAKRRRRLAFPRAT